MSVFEKQCELIEFIEKGIKDIRKEIEDEVENGLYTYIDFPTGGTSIQDVHICVTIRQEFKKSTSLSDIVNEVINEVKNGDGSLLLEDLETISKALIKSAETIDNFIKSEAIYHP
jgi:hypothetical protein